MTKTINQKLKEFRKNADLTVKELSDLTGISEVTIVGIETERITDPKFSTVVALLKGLGARMNITQKSFSPLDQIKSYLKSKGVM